MRLCELIAKLQQINDENHESDDWSVKVHVDHSEIQILRCDITKLEAIFANKVVEIVIR